MTRTLVYTALAAIACLGAINWVAPATAAEQTMKPSIVLVHGAYADGTSWSKVITLLQAKGYHVVSVQNPTTSLADDVTATERAISQQKGPVVLVGHSWAGVVITQAGNHPQVRALVYVDASAPDSGQSLLDAAAVLPSAPGASAGVKDEYGFLTLPEAAVRKYFAQDLSSADQGVIAATQTPWGIGCLTDKVTKAAWHDKPSWWVIGENDHMISPRLQEKMAAEIKARLTKVPTSHLAMLAAPKEVTAVIVDAANAVQSQTSAADLATGDTHSPAPDDAKLPAPPPAAPAPAALAPTARAVLGPAAVVALADEPAAKIFIDPPLAGSLAQGRVVIQYRADNLRIVPVFGTAALQVSPRIGHIHVTVDDAPWHWADASGEPLIINGLSAGPHKVLIQLADANHHIIDQGLIRFSIPEKTT